MKLVDQEMTPQKLQILMQQRLIELIMSLHDFAREMDCIGAGNPDDLMIIRKAGDSLSCVGERIRRRAYEHEYAKFSLRYPKAEG